MRHGSGSDFSTLLLGCTRSELTRAPGCASYAVNLEYRTISDAETIAPSPEVPPRGRIGWALYDWANSPFSTLIITFIFSVYFSRGIVGDMVEGQALWGYAIGISGIGVAVLSPVLGAIADAGGRRKPWLLVFTLLCATAAALLWFAEPDSSFLLWAMFWVIVGNFAFEFGVVFNNAMLPDLVAPHRIGRWSGWAWGIGYFGGLAALVVALFGFVQTETPLFGLDKEAAEHVRIVGPLVGLWFVAFVWPLFAFTPDRASTGKAPGEAIRAGLVTLIATLRDLRRHRNVALFLLARMIYNDGLLTVFAIGIIFAAGTFAMDEAEIIKFGIALNVTAGLGALAFGWIDDWLGSKRTIVIALIGILVAGIGALLATDVVWFWVAGLLLGTFLGPAQAASRTFMARLAPTDLRTEFFGLFAFSGKATAFAGPLLAGLVTQIAQSQRAGLATVIVFIAVGLVLLLGVRTPERAVAGASAAGQQG